MILVHPILAFVACVAAVVYWVVYCYRSASVGKTVTKILAVLPLFIFAISLGDRTLLFVALGLCLLGDILLSLEGDTPFLGGVGAFALGHVAYIALFLSHETAEPSMISKMPFVVVAIWLVLIAAFVAPILFRGAGPLRLAVVAYVPMIVGMGIAGLGFAQSLPLITIGALLFVASDLVLGLEMFVLRDGTLARKIAPFWVWATYWAAQVLIVIGFA